MKILRRAAVTTSFVVIFLASCSNEPPMRAVPTVVGRSPARARAILQQAGFSVALERPPAYCIPDDPLCSGPLTEEALNKLVVETQHGTKGEKRPAGSTITLILGSPVEGTRGH